MNRKILALAIVCATVVAVAVAVCGVLYLSLTQKQTLFRGAYAVYSGTLFLGFMSQDLVFRAEVADFNSTHVLVRVETTTVSTMYFTSTGKPETKVNKSVEERWFPKNLYSLLTHRGEEEVYVELLGRTRRCKVYVNSTDVMDMVYYVDKETMWPIKVDITVKQIGIQMTLKLVDTNIFKK